MATPGQEERHATGEAALLAAAIAGDETAFARVVELHAPRLKAHCYRMLGSIHDAEDALQETFVRAWRALPRFGGRSSVGTWLYRIATNVALDAIARRPKRVVPIDYGPPGDPHDGAAPPLPESVFVEPYADALLEGAGEPVGPAARYEQRESVELAFIAALQHLPGRQRAALVLRDVLGFSARETAEILDTTVPSANGALRRARQAASERMPSQSQQQSLRALGDPGLERLVGEYMRAWEGGDVEGILELLTDDAVITMPPRPSWFRGREAVGAFLERWPFASPDRYRLVRVPLNGQPGFAGYRWDPQASAHLPLVLHVLSLRDGRIEGIHGFLEPRLFRPLGLPERLGTAEPGSVREPGASLRG